MSLTANVTYVHLTTVPFPPDGAVGAACRLAWPAPTPQRALSKLSRRGEGVAAIQRVSRGQEIPQRKDLLTAPEVRVTVAGGREKGKCGGVGGGALQKAMGDTGKGEQQRRGKGRPERRWGLGERWQERRRAGGGASCKTHSPAAVTPPAGR